MTKHKIVIELDVEEGMESIVGNAAYFAIESVNERCRQERQDLHSAVLLLHNATRNKQRPQEVQAVMDSLREQARHHLDSYGMVIEVLSEISHAMSEADAQWRRSQATTAAPQPREV